MNNKRQTIWLVSMLSLMVILSAYYLFTEDAPKTGSTASGIETQLNGEDKTNAANADGISVSEVDQSTDELTGVTATGTDKESGSKEATSSDDSGLSPEDQEVLSGVANASTGMQKLDQIALDQQNYVSEKAEKLNAIIGDTKVSQEEAVSAQEELSRLEDTDSRITSLQSKLLQQFDNAVVQEEEGENFKVIVLSDKLEKKQAINILDMAMKELDVTPDRVTVQYVQ